MSDSVVSQAVHVSPESSCLAGDPVVLAEGLGRRFGRRWVLQGIDLQLAGGTVTGVVGPNGAGKTTLFRILVGILSPSAGSVKLSENLSYTALTVAAMLDQDGLLPQLTGAQTLRTWERLAGRQPDDAVENALARVGLTSAATRKIRSYSFGMRRRLVLARALLGSPRFLVLDEPGNGLDPAGLVQLQLLVREQANTGTTVLVSSHSLTEVDGLCDHVYYLSAGKFTEHWGPDSPQWWGIATQHPGSEKEQQALDRLNRDGWHAYRDPTEGIRVMKQTGIAATMSQFDAAGLDIIDVADLGRDLPRPFRESESWESQ